MANRVIGIADLGVVASPDTLTTYGLGSCVGLILYDPSSRVGGMAHIVLPESQDRDSEKYKAKYADTAFGELLEGMVKQGADLKKLIAKIAGGAHMFGSISSSNIMKIGDRNVEKCRALLKSRSIPVTAEDTGGNVGRTIEFSCETGMLHIRTAWPRMEKTI